MVVDARTQEIYDDIVEISDILLKRIYASGYDETNDTAHGRIVFQLLWLKQEIGNARLTLPLESDSYASLSYIYTNGNISDIESSKYLLHRLMCLVNNELLVKPEYYYKLINKIKDLLIILQVAPRDLSDEEKKVITELQDVILKLERKEILPYVDFTMESYPALWFIYTSWDGSTLDDIPGAGVLIKIISKGLLQGTRDDL